MIANWWYLNFSFCVTGDGYDRYLVPHFSRFKSLKISGVGDLSLWSLSISQLMGSHHDPWVHRDPLFLSDCLGPMQKWMSRQHEAELPGRFVLVTVWMWCQSCLSMWGGNLDILLKGNWQAGGKGLSQSHRQDPDVVVRRAFVLSKPWENEIHGWNPGPEADRAKQCSCAH